MVRWTLKAHQPTGLYKYLGVNSESCAGGMDCEWEQCKPGSFTRGHRLPILPEMQGGGRGDVLLSSKKPKFSSSLGVRQSVAPGRILCMRPSSAGDC